MNYPQTLRATRMANLFRLLKNPIALFTASRYASYSLQVIRGILIAKFLGPYLFGVWGFLMLAYQYLAYTSLGLQHAVNVELAAKIEEPGTHAEIIGDSLAASLLVTFGLAVIGLVLQATQAPLFEKYAFTRYVLALAIAVGLLHIQQLMANVYRVYKKLARIAASELVAAGLPLLAALTFREETLIQALLGAMICSGLVSAAIYLTKPPFKLRVTYERRRWGHLLAIGLPLLVYNLSFYMITMAARTVISTFYPVETMGYYSLASTITAATLLGLNAVSWVIFPDILARTQPGVPDDVVGAIVQKVNDIYSTCVFSVVFGAILGLPALFFILPAYRPTGGTLSILLLAQAVLSVSFGYNCVAIARKRELKVAGISLASAAVVTAVSLLMALLKLPFTWIAASVLVGAFVYTFWQAQLGRQTFVRPGRPSDFQSMLPWGSLVATLVILAGSLAGNTIPASLLGCAIFALTNRNKIKLVYDFITHKAGLRNNVQRA